MKEEEQIYKGLNLIMKACGFQGESGTEALFAVLWNATDAVSENWDEVVGQSHRDGLCYDVNAWLAHMIASAVARLDTDEQTVN